MNLDPLKGIVNLEVQPAVDKEFESLYIEFYLIQERLDNLNPLILQELSKQNLDFISDIKKVTQAEYCEYETEYGIEKAKSLNEQIKKFYQEIISKTSYIFKQKPILGISTGRTEPQETMYSNLDNTLYVKPKKTVDHIECDLVISRTDDDKKNVPLNEAKRKKTVKLIDFNYKFLKDTFGDLKIEDIVVTKDYSPELDIKYQINSNKVKDINLNRYYYLIHEYENIFAVYQILINGFEVSVLDSNIIYFFKVPETCKFYGIKNPLLYSDKNFALTYCALLNEQINEPKKSIENKAYTWHIDTGSETRIGSNFVGLEYKEGKFKGVVKSKPQNLDFDKGFELSFKNNEDISKKLNNWFILWNKLDKNQVNIPNQLIESSKQIKITKDMPEYETDPVINFFKQNIQKDYVWKIGDIVKALPKIDNSFRKYQLPSYSFTDSFKLTGMLGIIIKINFDTGFIDVDLNGLNVKSTIDCFELVEINQDSIQAKKKYLNQEYEDFEGVILQDQNKPTTKEIFVI